jgi:hypothetical protein
MRVRYHRMKPLFQNVPIERRKIEERNIVDVQIRMTPTAMCWLFPNDDLVDTLAVGPKNAKFWWILPRNYTIL